ncbi:MAG: AraC family transcriptional regulator ligand-binding domain-containing protein [Acidobacteriota bacterium]
MGWISVVFAHKVIDVATRGGPDAVARRGRLLRSVGLDPGTSGSPEASADPRAVDPGQLISDTEFFGLLERIADRLDRGREVALRVGASMRCDDYGAFGLAFKSAVDLRARMSASSVTARS